MVTAKVVLQGKQSTGANGEEKYLSFVPDYADGRNREWARATPSLSLAMTVKNDVADRFEVGAGYTLTFERDDTQEPALPANG